MLLSKEPLTAVRYPKEKGDPIMAIGERIHFFRTLRGMTQKYLGQSIGFPEKTADVRVAQYESGKRSPKDDIVQLMASALDVAPGALTVPDIDSYQGLMHTLFTLEDRYGLTVAKIEGQLCLRMDVNHPAFDAALLEELSDWNELKDRYRNGSISQADYDHWRYHYLEDKSAEFRNRMDELRTAGSQSEDK